MPVFGKNASNPPGKAGKNKQGQGTQVNLGRKASKSKFSRKPAVDPDDMPLNPEVAYGEEEGYSEPVREVTPVGAFEDDLIHPRLRGLTVIPRAGGEETAVLRDFLDMYTRTGTVLGDLARKTSFMKKTGGRLL